MMDGKPRLKHVERLTEIKKFLNVASFWLYTANILAMHGPMNVKFKDQYLARAENRTNFLRSSIPYPLVTVKNTISPMPT